MVETDYHDRVGELGAVMGAVAFGTLHIVAAGAEGEDVGAAVGVGLEWFIMFGEEVENVALSVGDFGENVITPNNKPDDCSEEEDDNNKNDTSDDFAFFTDGFFLLFEFLGLELVVGNRLGGFELAGFFVKIK